MSARLFLAVWATAILAVVAMGGAARWSFERGFVGYLNEQALARMEASLPGLAAARAQNGNWDFLRGSMGAWFDLMRPFPEADREHLIASTPFEPPVSDLTGAILRLRLLDEERRYVVGFRDANSEREKAVERPVVWQGRTVGWVAMVPFQSVAEAGDQRFQRSQRQASWAVGIVAVLFAAGIAGWVTRALLRPVRRVAEATHRLAGGDYTGRVEATSDDEVGQLARDFNHLAETLQRNEQVRRDFMADVSHELRTPLGVLHGELEAMEDGVRPLDARTVASLQAEVAMLNKLVNDLYDLSLADVGAMAYRRDTLDLVPLLELVAHGFRSRLADAGLSLELQRPDSPVPVFGDERRLHQLIGNLLENSARYTDAGGRVRLVLRVDNTPRGREAVVDCHDSAPGVPPDVLPRLFQRFFRVDGSRNRASGGSGLGLAICSSIVQAHGGTITVAPSPLGGLAVEIRIAIA